MLDLQDISNNLLLVGFALLSICLLYLLYSNFTKVREISELKLKVEDLKNIFINQQKHNDDTYIKMIKMLETRDNNTNENTLDNINQKVLNDNTIQNTIPTKVINIKNNLLTSKMLNVSTNGEDDNNDSDDNSNKIINIDLQDLDDLDNFDDMNDIDNINDMNDIDKNSDENDNDNDNENEFFGINNDIYDLKTSLINIEVFDDANSITTDPIDNMEDLDNIEDLDNLDNLDTMEDLDNLDTMEDLDNLDTIEDLDNMEDLDNLDNIEDLDNLDTMEDLDTVDITKEININNNSSLVDTIINNNTNEINDNSTDIKSVLFNDTNSTETIELDKLLSGDIKKIDLTENTENKKYNLEELQAMSIKQLKELAKNKKIKSIGNKTKVELIDFIVKN